MIEALAVAALLISAAALLLAWRAVSAAERAAAASSSRSLPAAAPVAPPMPPPPSTDPSVLVRLDAMESRQASLELRSSVGTAALAAPRGSEPDAAAEAKDPAARRPYAMFP